MRQRARVDDDGVVVALLEPVDERALVVRLEGVERVAQASCVVARSGFDLGERRRAVDLGLALAEPAEVGAVEQQDPHAARLRRVTVAASVWMREGGVELGLGDVVDLARPGPPPWAGSSAGDPAAASCRCPSARLTTVAVEGAAERVAERVDDGVDARRQVRLGAAAGGDGGHGAEAEHDRLAMRQAVAALDLEGVAEVWPRLRIAPLAALEGVALDDAELEAHGALDDGVAGGLVVARAPHGRGSPRAATGPGRR